MENNYTQIDILQYIYNELDNEKSIIIEDALQDDVELREEYEQTIKVLGLLDRLSENPSPTTIDIIVEYSTAMSRQKAWSVNNQCYIFLNWSNPSSLYWYIWISDLTIVR